MNQPLTLFQRFARNLRWYVEDVVTAVTGRARPFHFVYGRATNDETNPTTGQPMIAGVDVNGVGHGAANVKH